MRAIRATLFVLIVCIPQPALADPGDQAWTSYDLVSSYHNPDAIAVSPDGATVYVAGRSGRGTVAVIAYDAVSGTRRWVSRGHPGGPVDLIVSDRGNVLYVAGSTPRPRDYLLQAFRAADGAALWTATYDGPDSETDVATALAVADDQVFVAGQSRTAHGDRDIAIVAYDRTGDRAWARRYGAAPNETARSLALADGAVFAGGWSNDDGRESPIVLAYDGSTGARTWISIGEPPGRVIDVAVAGTLLVATGTGRSTEGREAPTFALEISTGVEVWRHVRDLDLWSLYPVDLAADVEGPSVFVTARTRPFGTWTPERYGSNAVTWSLDVADGGLRWQRVVDRDEYDVPRALAVAADGTAVAVGGQSGDDDVGTDHMSIALDAATGAVRWVRIHPLSFEGMWTQDIVWDVTFGPDGSRVFVTGEGYTPSAARRWVTRAYRT